MALLSRSLVILFAFLVACLAAAALMVVGLMAQGMIQTGQGLALLNLGAVIPAIVLAVKPAIVVVIALASLPAAVVVITTEFYRLHVLRYYVVAGAVIGLICQLVFRAGIASILMRNPRTPTSIQPLRYLVGVAIAVVVGIAAGCVYWAIAGRNAGRWRDAAAQ